MTANRFNFRCWDKQNQHMFYNGYNCWEDTHITTHDYLGLSLGGDIYRQWEYVDNAPELANLTEEATDEYILMQSTGLADKNNKEIYEGDILTDGSIKYLVYFEEEKAQFIMKPILCGKTLLTDYEELGKRYMHYYEIIGNIYENKDILGE